MKLVWTKQAIADLNAAYGYIAETAPEAAEVIIERIERSLESLQQFPEMGRLERVKETRELVIPRTPFILPYRVHKKRIEVLA
ncbi:MAG: type II toxin-antitoxin system RelE/ParE family toxin, partial [Cyanobacteria bacterium J06638_22]